MASGTCLCATVRYEVDQPFTMMGHCHCSMCRKHHGSLFVTWVGAPCGAFRWIAGQDAIDSFQSSEHGKRSFCRTCGSVTPTLLPQIGLAFLPAGNLVGDLGLKPQYHMFVGSKAPWYQITDELPQHATFPPPYESPGVERPRVAAKDGVTQGSCLCGDVAFEFTGKAERVFNCHCSRCRRARGAAHGTNLFVKPENFRWVRGEDRVASYKLPEAKRFGQAFCMRCGSAAPRILPQLGMAVIPAGSLDTDPGIQSQVHIFTGSKANWFDITGSTPQFAELPPTL
jgi:hypothetical protein